MIIEFAWRNAAHGKAIVTAATNGQPDCGFRADHDDLCASSWAWCRGHRSGPARTPQVPSAMPCSAA